MTDVPSHRRWVHRIVARVSRGVGALRATPSSGLRVLLYHAVGSRVPHDQYGMSVTPRAFAEQMRWLREDSGYDITSLESGADALTGRPTGGPQVAVTFDDGFMDVLTVAAPVLARYQIPFTAFVVGGYLERPPASGLYLDPAALRDLAAAPHASIGAHGFTHQPLTHFDHESLGDELRRSRDAVRMCVGTDPLAIGYPYGAVNRDVIGGVEAAGFVIGATSFIGMNRSGVHPLCLRRTEVLAADGLAEFSGRLRGDYDWYSLRQRLYQPPPH